MKNKNKLIKILIIMGILLFLIIGLSFLLKKERTLNDSINILSEKGYYLYYNLDIYGNMYDKDKNCYNVEFQKSECLRDIINDLFSPTMYIVKHDKEVFNAMSVRDNKIAISYNTEINDNEYSYVWYPNLEYEYIVKSNDDNTCVYNITGELLEDFEICSTNKSEFNQVSKELNKLLKEMDVSKEELVTVFEDLYSNYLVTHKKEIENTSLNNEDVEKILKENYIIKSQDNSVFLYEILYPNKQLLFTINNNKIETISYSSSVYSDSYLITDYRVDNIAYYSGNSNCMYSLKTNMEIYSCNDEEILDAKLMNYEYIDLSRELKVTESELKDFAIYYFNKTER